MIELPSWMIIDKYRQLTIDKNALRKTNVPDYNEWLSRLNDIFKYHAIVEIDLDKYDVYDEDFRISELVYNNTKGLWMRVLHEHVTHYSRTAQYGAFFKYSFEYPEDAVSFKLVWS